MFSVCDIKQKEENYKTKTKKPNNFVWIIAFIWHAYEYFKQRAKLKWKSNTNSFNQISVKEIMQSKKKFCGLFKVLQTFI